MFQSYLSFSFYILGSFFKSVSWWSFFHRKELSFGESPLHQCYELQISSPVWFPSSVFTCSAFFFLQNSTPLLCSEFISLFLHGNWLCLTLSKSLLILRLKKESMFSLVLLCPFFPPTLVLIILLNKLVCIIFRFRTGTMLS